MIGNRMEVVLGGCLGELDMKRTKGMRGGMGVQWWPLHCVIDIS
jgi:hypothetical protein